MGNSASIAIVVAVLATASVALAGALRCGPNDKRAKGLLALHWAIVLGVAAMQWLVARAWMGGRDMSDYALQATSWASIIAIETMLGMGLVLAYRRDATR